MIEFDIVNYLISDTTLANLLEATGSDSKVYPIQIPHKRSTPFLVYNIMSEGGNREHLKEITISFDAIDESYLKAKQIRDRVAVLLDRESNIRRLAPSTDYWLYYSKNVGGSTFIDPEIYRFHNISIYNFLYNPVSIPIIVETIIPEPGADKTHSFAISGTMQTGVRISGYKPRTGRIYKEMQINLEDAPTGSDSLIVDIRFNGTRQNVDVTVAPGSKWAKASISNLIVNPTDSIDVEVVQVGDTFPGASATVTFVYQ